jgi:biotin carboxyl carrier protein
MIEATKMAMIIETDRSGYLNAIGMVSASIFVKE